MATATQPAPSVRGNSRALIQEFLSQKRIALVGLSRDPRDFSRTVLRELVRHKYCVVPVHPLAKMVAGASAYPRVQDIQPPVEAVLLMTRPNITERVVRDCAEAGVRIVWMHRGGGAGAVSEEAVAFCRQRGMEVIAGECPLMFLNPGFVHRFHAFVKKLARRYPK